MTDEDLVKIVRTVVDSYTLTTKESIEVMRLYLVAIRAGRVDFDRVRQQIHDKFSTNSSFKSHREIAALTRAAHLSSFVPYDDRTAP